MPIRNVKTKSTRGYHVAMVLEEKRVEDKRVHWDAITHVVSRVEPRTSRTVVSGRQEQEVVKYDIYVPWRRSIFNNAAERRLKVIQTGVEYYIEGVVDLMESHREYKVTCSKG